MKKILLIVILLAVSLFANEWLDYDEALEKAQQEDKLMLVMLSQAGCPACKYMKDVVLPSKNVSKEIKKNFVFVELDINEEKIPKKLDYMGTPTFHFLDKNGKKLDVSYGSSNVEDFMITLEEVTIEE